jgi:NADPH2:quinone reductase
MTWAQAAAVPTPYFTAYRALFERGWAGNGSTVLVHGASGGVGLAAVELASRKGCFVIGTSSTERGRAAVMAAGAKAAVAHGDVEAIRAALPAADGEAAAEAAATAGGRGGSIPCGLPGGPRGVDLVVENLSNMNLGADLTLLARGGTVAVVGCRGPAEINPRDLMTREATIVGVAMAHATQEQLDFMMDDIGDWLAGEPLVGVKPVVGVTYPGLASAGEAHEEVIEHRAGSLGKIVILVD